MMSNEELLETLDGLCLAEYEKEDDKMDNRFLNEVYKIVHSHRTTAVCHDIHTQWREESEKIRESLKKAKYI